MSQAPGSIASMTAPALPPVRRRPVGRVVALVSAVVLVDVCFYSAITPLLPSYVADLHLSTSQAGLLSGAYAVGTLLASLPAGWLASRAETRGTLVAGLGLLAAASLAFGLAGSFVALASARFVQGVAGAAAWAAGLAWLVEVTPRERRAQTIGAVLGTGIAGAIGGPVLGALAHALGPRPVFAGVGVVAVVLAVGVALTPAGGEPPPSGDLRGVLRERTVLAGAWLTTLPTLYFGAFAVLVPLRLDDLGVGATGVAAVFLAAAAVEAAASPVAGRLADRRGRLLPIRVGLTGVLVTAVLLPLQPSPWRIAVVVVTGAAISGGLLTPASALLSDGAEAAGAPQGLVFGLFNLAWAIGQVGGAAGGARLAEATSAAAPFLVVAGLAAVTLLAVAGVRVRGLRVPPAS
jgi:predicted MFS family arabinose efflux permease